MKVTANQLAQAPVCATCCDYVDFPDCKLVRGDDGWVHFVSQSARCPGQGDDDTGDEAEPLIEGHWYVIAFDRLGENVTGHIPVWPRT